MSDYTNDDTGQTPLGSTDDVNSTESDYSEPGFSDETIHAPNNSSRISDFGDDDTGERPIDDSTVLTDVGADSAPSSMQSERIISEAPQSSSFSQQDPQATSYAQPESGTSSESFAAPRNGSRAEFTTAFDIIDEMQHNLDEAKTALFSPQTAKIDKAEFSEYLDELKKVLPVQLERASALMRESERRLEAAQEQAESVIRGAQRNAEDIINKANEQADFLAGHQNVVALAEDKARTIISNAQAKADHVTAGANEYSSTMLANLEVELEKLSRDVKGGISILRTREQEAASKLDRIDGNLNEENRS